MKQWWDITEEDQKAIMENTEWCMADNGYFRGADTPAVMKHVLRCLQQ